MNNQPLLTLCCLFLLLSGVFKLNGQSEQLAKHIEGKLVTINKVIAEKDYVLALSKLTDLENYEEYISVDENRLFVNLKKGEAYYNIQNEEKAMELLLEGLDDLESLNLPQLKIKYSNYLGEIFRDSKDYTRSIDYYKKAFYTSSKVKDTLELLKSNLAIGLTFKMAKQIDSAVSYYKNVINLQKVNNINGKTISRAYNNLSNIANDDDDLELAEEYINKSIDIKKLQKDTLGAAIGLINLSSILYKKKDFLTVRNNYLEAYEAIKNFDAKKIRILRIRESLLYNLAYVNDELKDFEKAFRYLEQATNLTDSLSEVSAAKNISEIEAKYNVAEAASNAEKEKSKRQRAQFFSYATIFAFISMLVVGYIFYRNYRLKQEREVDKLASDAQIKIINATIDAKEKERKSIAEILHDSVSALLSSANLHLQATKAQLKTGYPQEITKAQTIVNEASVKIRDLSHELISSVLLKFGLAFAVHDMCQKYSNSEISLFSDDDGVKRYEQDFEIKIHSIIEELVNNILKHSKAKNATIMLAHRENNMLSIRMNDDGIGFDAKKAKTKGGLGLSHIDARITVMKGVFNIVSSKNNGTSIFILVPIVPRA